MRTQKDRLNLQIARAPRAARDDCEDHVLIGRLLLVVQSMDRGLLSPKDALEFFAGHSVPGFSFGEWLVEMVDEGVYLEGLFNQAA